MNEDNLRSLLDSITEYGDRKYTSPSGAFLEYLRRKALEEDLISIVEACKIYFEIFPNSRRYVIQNLPAILSNSYLAIREDLDYGKYIHWSISNNQWHENIRNSISDSRKLQLCLDDIVFKANTFKE